MYFAFKGGGFHPFCSAEHDDGWRWFLFCWWTRERHVHPPVLKCAQQVSSLSVTSVAHLSFLKRTYRYAFFVFGWYSLGIIGCTTPPPIITAMRTVVCCAFMPVQTPDRWLQAHDNRVDNSYLSDDSFSLNDCLVFFNQQVREMVEIITREFIQMAGNTGEVVALFQCEGNSTEL